ncbi:hypothetical protein NQO50_000072 [Vibrio vulnificus]|nr:hypothetical protein [Vibrio vulnificus]EJN6713810.1 hypothetical protein [Vibrio vulnificus]EJQ9990148.1 hypothetical protein [Vibrio vulnificus]ELV8652444.1 hypothetical protein [Vibrio vulnificus]MCU8432443.1 hypothetical protein [Vibrio vulnificus]
MKNHRHGGADIPNLHCLFNDLRAIERHGKKQKLAYLAFLSERLPSKVNISHPQGGMVLWLQVPGLNLSQFAALLEENRIDIRLGRLFSTLSLYNDCLRINIGFELTQEVQDELSLLAAAIAQSCERT